MRFVISPYVYWQGGYDLSFPVIRDYATLITNINEERSALFNHVRERIFQESWEKAAREATKHNLHRRHRLFEKGDLVIVRAIAKDRNEPRWSLPHRVILVLRNGNGARVEDLSTGKIVDTHISNVKFLHCPDNEIQINEWIEELSANENANQDCIRRTMDLLHLEHTSV